jgi:urease accessory protein
MPGANMTELTVIRKMTHDQGDRRMRLLTDRATLAKRRWRGVAEDGREFGFDLDEPLTHGTTFFAEEDRCYVLEQTPEEVLEIPVATVELAARIGWSLGNLHFGVQVLPEAVRVTDDPAVLQFLQREDVAFRRVKVVFLPLSPGAQSHAHDHSHSHG